MIDMDSRPWANFGALCTKSIKIFSENPIFEAYDHYLHIKIRNALNIKMHTTPAQSLQ